ncbi:hypothetical protein [Streptosporangium sp. LJ11]
MALPPTLTCGFAPDPPSPLPQNLRRHTLRLIATVGTAVRRNDTRTAQAD